MDAYTAASKAFNKCKSRMPGKNEACAPYLAKLYLTSAGVRGSELEVAMEYVHRMLDEWFAKKATNKDFFPQPIDEENHETDGVPTARNIIQPMVRRASDVGTDGYR